MPAGIPTCIACTPSSPVIITFLLFQKKFIQQVGAIKMQNLARKMTTAMTYPGAFFRYQSKPLRSFYHALSRAAHVQTFLKRCNDNADTYSAKKLTIEDADGFSVFSPS